MLWIAFGKQHWTVFCYEISRLFRTEIFAHVGYRYENPEQAAFRKETGTNSNAGSTTMNLSAAGNLLNSPYENVSPIRKERRGLPIENHGNSGNGRISTENKRASPLQDVKTQNYMDNRSSCSTPSSISPSKESNNNSNRRCGVAVTANANFEEPF